MSFNQSIDVLLAVKCSPCSITHGAHDSFFLKLKRDSGGGRHYDCKTIATIPFTVICAASGP